MSIETYKIKKGTRYAVRHYLHLDENGKKKYHVKKGFKTKKEAKLYEDRLAVSLALGDYRKETTLSFKEVYKKWLPAYENTVEVTTLSRTKDLFRLHILPAFGAKKIAAITPLNCQEQITAWSKQLKNIKQLKSYTSQIFEFAINMQLIQNNPMQRIIMPKVAKNRSYNFWSFEELHRFLDIVEHSEPFKHYALFRLLAYSGMRKGELYALKWTDIDFKSNLISITKNLAHLNSQPIEKRTKNQFSVRTILMDQETMDILKNWKEIQQKQLIQSAVIPLDSLNNYCFTYVNSKGKIQPLHADYANNILNKVIKNYGLKKISAHGLRHTHATLLTEIGVDPVNTSQRLGHVSPQTTLDVYGHTTTKGEAETISRFSNYLEKQY